MRPLLAFALPFLAFACWWAASRLVSRERAAKHRLGAPQRIEFELLSWIPPPPRINQSPLGGPTSEHPLIAETGVSDTQAQRALFALDAIRFGVENRLGLKAQLLSREGVTTVHSNLAYDPGDRRIVRAATKALTGKTQPKVRR